MDSSKKDHASPFTPEEQEQIGREMQEVKASDKVIGELQAGAFGFFGSRAHEATDSGHSDEPLPDPLAETDESQ
jgi:hypothetical protein